MNKISISFIPIQLKYLFLNFMLFRDHLISEGRMLRNILSYNLGSKQNAITQELISLKTHATCCLAFIAQVVQKKCVFSFLSHKIFELLKSDILKY